MMKQKKYYKVFYEFYLKRCKIFEKEFEKKIALFENTQIKGNSKSAKLNKKKKDLLNKSNLSPSSIQFCKVVKEKLKNLVSTLKMKYTNFLNNFSLLNDLIEYIFCFTLFENKEEYFSTKINQIFEKMNKAKTDEGSVNASGINFILTDVSSKKSTNFYSSQITFKDYFENSFKNILTDDEMMPMNTSCGQTSNKRQIPFISFKNLELTTLFFVFYFQKVN